jgi:hypothetical protein
MFVPIVFNKKVQIHRVVRCPRDLDRADDHRKTSLTLLEMANLFNFPQNVTERFSEATAIGPSSHDSADLDRLVPVDIKTDDSKKCIDNILNSIGYMEGRMDRIESRRLEIRDELKNLARAIEVERSRTRKHELERSYPMRGVFTVGFLISLIGLLILLPFQLPSFIQFLFGIGFLLIGISVSIASLTRMRKKSTRPEQ